MVDETMGRTTAPDRDAGFTMLETIVSVFVVGVVMSALTSFFVTTVSVTNQQGGVQAATQVAADAISRVRAMKGSTLATGRDATSSHTQWNAPVSGVAPYLVDMNEVWDPAAAYPAGQTAALPTVPTTVPVNTVSYRQHWYLGSCWQPAAGGACQKVQTAGAVAFFRVVVAVTWPDRRCALSACSYVTSTLVSSVSGEPIFNLNEGARRPVLTNPGNQTGLVNSAVSLQLVASSSAPPLTWTITGLPPGLTSSAGLITGTLPGTVGTYTVSVAVKDNFNLVSTTSFTWTVSDPGYPTMVLKDGPWAYYRMEEAASASATLTAVDSSGNNRPGTQVGATDGPTTWWPLDEGTGAVATDASGAANPGSLTNAPAWTTGPSGSALSFAGTASVQGARPAVHTNRNFTVTAWAYLAAGGGSNKAVISQNGSNSYGYALRYHASSNKWTFALPNSDTTDPTNTQVYSASTAVTGRWVHLAGVFDAAAGRATLYVDGVASGSVARSAGWDARGRVQVGAEQWNGVQTDPFNGRIDDVRAYQRALPAGDIADLAADPAKLRWDFSEGSGTTTTDIAGGDNNGTLGSAATWAGAANGHTGNAASFAADAANGYVASAGSPVRTDQSFTVSAWVYLTTTGVFRTAVSQSGAVVSGFYIQYEPNLGKWVFTMPKADSITGGGDLIASSTAAATNTWVHLTGVYDAGAATIALYVNGVSQGTVPRTAAWNAAGATEVGRGRYNSAPADPWNGRIDSVRLYQRVLTATEIAAVVAEAAPAPLMTPADMTAGLEGALPGAEKNSTGFGFASSSNGYGNTSMTNPAASTAELWFRAADNRGGVLIGFYANKTGPSGSRDRQVYLDSGGRLTFGVYPSSSSVTVRSPAVYTDGQWHHLAASSGPAGMKLHVDGVLVISNAAATTAGTHTGYWRWGGGDTTLWPNRPADDYFTGTIDEVAIYTKQLTDAQVAAHYQSAASGRISTYAATVLARSGLVSYWRLGETAGTTVADSEPSGANNGTYVGGPSLGVAGALSGDADKAVTFNGSTQYATVARQIQDDYSIEFLFRSTGGRNGTSWSYGSGMVDADTSGVADDFGVSLRADGKIMAGTGATGGSDTTITSSSGGYNDGAWHHVVFTRARASGAMILYVDGAVAASGTGSTTSSTSTATINLGRASGGYYFAGSLDEVAVYNTVLTATEVATHAARG